MVEKKTIISPLRYPGSKRRLVGYITEALELNSFKPSLYVEPFVGGGSSAINLLSANMVEKAILVDIDPWIASFWQTVFFDTEWLIEQIKTVEVSLDQYYKYKSSTPTMVRDQAITCLFLNRTSFSGILKKRTGPIGGKDQKSEYTIDCRFTPKTRITLINRIIQISQYANRIIGVWCCSWDEAVKKIREEQAANNFPQEDLFFYLDPPFFKQADALYRYYFTDEDHKALRDFLLSLEDKWLLSYDSAEQVEILYGEALRKRTNSTKHHNIDLTYTIAGVSERKKGKEFILSNFDNLPNID